MRQRPVRIDRLDDLPGLALITRSGRIDTGGLVHTIRLPFGAVYEITIVSPIIAGSRCLKGRAAPGSPSRFFEIDRVISTVLHEKSAQTRARINVISAGRIGIVRQIIAGVRVRPGPTGIACGLIGILAGIGADEHLVALTCQAHDRMGIDHVFAIDRQGVLIPQAVLGSAILSAIGHIHLIFTERIDSHHARRDLIARGHDNLLGKIHTPGRNGQKRYQQ